MKTRKNILTSLVIALAIGLTFGTGSANAAVIYNDDFSGSSADNLNGTTPDKVSGDFGTSGATWNAAADFKADGTLSGGNDVSALLPFQPEAGWIYTLEVTDSYFNNRWYMRGFANGSATTSQTLEDHGLAFIINRDEGDGYQYHVMAGPGYDSLDSGFLNNVGDPTDYVLTLDATDGLDQVKLSASIDGTEVLTESVVNYTSTGRGAIEYVALGKNSNDGGDFDSLTLTAIPEPASLGLFGIVIGALCFVRRKFRGIAS